MKKWIKIVAGLDPYQSGDNSLDVLNKITSNAAFKELERKCEAHGYRLYAAATDPRGFIHMSIQAQDPRCPDIYLTSKTQRFGRPSIGDVAVKISTVSHGTLGLVDYNGYLAAVQSAYDLGKFLEAWDKWDQLYVDTDPQ